MNNNTNVFDYLSGFFGQTTKVFFDANIVQAIYTIPNRDEIMEMCQFVDLWWDKSDIQRARKEAVHEFRLCKRENPYLTKYEIISKIWHI